MTILKKLWLFTALVLLFIYPLAGIVLAIPIIGDKLVGLSSFSNNQYFKAWLFVWLPYFLLLLVPLLFHNDWYGIFSHILQVVFVVLLFLVFRSMYKATSKHWIASAIAVSLAIMALAGIGERVLGARTWLNNDTNFIKIVRSSLQKEQNISFPDNLYRIWQIAPHTDSVNISWKAKLISGTTNWDWQSRTQKENLEIVKGSKTYTHFTPKGKDSFIYRSLSQPSTISGLSVRSIIELRSSDEEENCGIFSLSDLGATITKSVNICANKQWQSYALDWKVPNSTKKDLTLVLNHFNSPLDIGKLKLEIKPENTTTWQTVDTLEPNGASIRLNWENAWLEELLLEERFSPTTEWQNYSLDLQADSLKDATKITGVITGERGLTIAVKDTVISGNQSIQAIAGDNLRRLKLWFHHPNLMGHATVAITLAGLALSQATVSTVLIIIFGIFLIILSGSRAAMLTLGIGILLLLFFKSSKNLLRTRRLTRIASLVLIPTLLIITITQFEAFSRLTFGVGRMDIWSVAWQAIQQAPLFGIGFGNFPEFFESIRPNRAVVNHAHNLAFVYLSNYGLLGGLAIAWLLSSWLFLIARARNFRTTSIFIVPLVCIIFANIFDFSFFNAAVITALTAIIPFEYDNNTQKNVM